MRLLLLLLFSLTLVGQRLLPHTLATDLKGGYQVIAVDLNQDGRLDLIALASGLDHLDWFENPGSIDKPWPRHVIASGFRQLINVAALDGDLLVAHEFSNIPDKYVGTVSLLTRKDGAWVRRDIDAIPTSHRLRVVNGQFLNAPLSDPKSKPPDYRGSIPLTLYEKGTLKPKLVSNADSGVMHGIHITDFDGDGREDILTASFNGLYLLRSLQDGSFERTLIHTGHAEAWPKSGASDVTVAKVKGRKYLASIEPWHGNELAMYTPDAKGKYSREVVDSSMNEGHTVIAADLDRDGVEEVIYGSRKDGGTLRIAKFEDGKWKVTPLMDGQIATNACAAADLDGDGRIDVVCIGGASANLVVFQNLK